MEGNNSGRGPAMRATYPGNRKRPQTQVKSGGRRVSMGLGVNVAWGGPRGFHGPEMYGGVGVLPSGLSAWAEGGGS